MGAFITDIKKFAVHDGDGIRTTVFFKGCPLRCVWCHNPEGISAKKEIAYYAHKCISCGRCTKICKANRLDGEHIFDRNECALCGECVDLCPGSAFVLYGKSMEVSDIMPILLEDKIFYESSGGGITLSGGECLMQADFCRELLIECKKEGLNTAVDTSGFVSREAFDKVLPYTDVFLYDVKAIDEGVHIACTGRSNSLILENLKYIDSLGAKTEIRIPYVPGYNDMEIEKIAEFLKTLKSLLRVRVLPYHNYAKSKYDALGIKDTLPDRLPSEKEISEAEEKIEKILNS